MSLFAEIAPDPKDYPGALPNMPRAGSLVFFPPKHPIEDMGNWRPVGGRSSLAPTGGGPPGRVARSAGSTIIPSFTSPIATPWLMRNGRVRTCRPKRNGSSRPAAASTASFAWGDELTPGGKQRANTWQGAFPHENLKLDGYERTSPVTAFPPNGYGVYDMIGNVGMDQRLVLTQTRRRGSQGVLHSEQSAGRS